MVLIILTDSFLNLELSGSLVAYLIKARGYTDIWDLPFDDHLTLHFGINNTLVNDLPNESTDHTQKLIMVSWTNNQKNSSRHVVLGAKYI